MTFITIHTHFCSEIIVRLYLIERVSPKEERRSPRTIVGSQWHIFIDNLNLSTAGSATQSALSLVVSYDFRCFVT